MFRFPLPLVLLLVSGILFPGEAAAQTAAVTPKAATTSTSPEPPSAVLTLKERLGAKWKDEQRVDNCHVPIEKRGPKPRPATCTKPRSD